MATQNKKSLNKEFFEDLKARQLTEEEQEKFSRLIYNKKISAVLVRWKPNLKKVLSIEESEFDKLAGRGMALIEGFYTPLEEADKKGRAIDVFRNHRDNVHALLNDCHDTPQDSYFYEMVGFLNMVVHIIEQISDGGSFPLSTEQFFMLIKASNSTGEEEIAAWKALEQLSCRVETFRLD